MHTIFKQFCFVVYLSSVLFVEYCEKESSLYFFA